MSLKRRIRVLQVVGGLVRGGVETWLMHMLRNIDRDCFQMDFAVQNANQGEFRHEARDLGCKILACGSHKRPLAYAKKLRGALREQGPYDIVHSHVAHYTGHVLRQARLEHVGVRLSHSHNSWQAPKPLWRRSYEGIQKRWIQKYSTGGLACSALAAESLFGRRWRSDNRFRVLLYGFDFSPFHGLSEKNEAKRALGIPSQCVVLGHVGRFHPQKNHALLLEIFHQIVRSGVDAHLVLVGTGDLLPAIKHVVHARGLQNRVLFAGVQANVAPYFQAMDLFVFPSRYEGLGAVVLETQAAGVPAVISDSVPPEADVIGTLIRRVPPNASSDRWARHVLEWIESPPRAEEPAAALENSPFSLRRCVHELEHYYVECCGKVRQEKAAA